MILKTEIMKFFNDASDDVNTVITNYRNSGDIDYNGIADLNNSYKYNNNSFDDGNNNNDKSIDNNASSTDGSPAQSACTKQNEVVNVFSSELSRGVAEQDDHRVARCNDKLLATVKSTSTAENHQLSEDTKICLCLNEQEDSASLTDDSGLESAASSWGKSVAEVNEHAFAKLEEELQNAHEKLKLRDEEVSKLSRIRQEVESELQELTASLFQEAHTMVREANLRQAAAEKALKESHMKVEVLMAEVSALKTLVLTSTPSKPNLHLHNQTHAKCKSAECSTAIFFKKHHRSPSHFELKYGRESPPSASSTEEIFILPQSNPLEVNDGFEIDPNIYSEFILWKESPILDESSPFIGRIYKEDIDLCLSFNNTELADEVKTAIACENIYVEAVDKAKSQFPRKCALMEVQRLCLYRMKLGSSETYHYISQICRNRIISVCNFLNYLRYIQRGLVKSSVNDMYWEIIKLRKEMTLARLGLPESTEHL